jgi:hypothetical protein
VGYVIILHPLSHCSRKSSGTLLTSSPTF